MSDISSRILAAQEQTTFSEDFAWLSEQIKKDDVLKAFEEFNEHPLAEFGTQISSLTRFEPAAKLDIQGLKNPADKECSIFVDSEMQEKMKVVCDLERAYATTGLQQRAFVNLFGLVTGCALLKYRRYYSFVALIPFVIFNKMGLD